MEKKNLFKKFSILEIDCSLFTLVNCLSSFSDILMTFWHIYYFTKGYYFLLLKGVEASRSYSRSRKAKSF